MKNNSRTVGASRSEYCAPECDISTVANRDIITESDPWALPEIPLDETNH